MSMLDQIKWNDAGLVPCVTQDAADGRVLMLAWMNRESVEKTLATGAMHYWSRSRKSLWQKGETSGNTQKVEEFRLDCDGDTILAKVIQKGPACHTQSPTCFYRKADGDGLSDVPENSGFSAVLSQVYEVIGQRKDAGDAEKSYVAGLFAKGREAILAKVAEESEEVIEAARENGSDHFTHEVADLFFHVMVSMAEKGVTPDDVAVELARRFGTSGLAEKASRKKK